MCDCGNNDECPECAFWHYDKDGFFYTEYVNPCGCGHVRCTECNGYYRHNYFDYTKYPIKFENWKLEQAEKARRLEEENRKKLAEKERDEEEYRRRAKYYIDSQMKISTPSHVNNCIDIVNTSSNKRDVKNAVKDIRRYTNDLRQSIIFANEHNVTIDEANQRLTYLESALAEVNLVYQKRRTWLRLLRAWNYISF